MPGKSNDCFYIFPSDSTFLSLLVALLGELILHSYYYGTNLNPETTDLSHTEGCNAYLVPKTGISMQVFRKSLGLKKCFLNPAPLLRYCT